MALTEIVYINFRGGIVSPGMLQEVLQIASDAKINEVRFGLRQQLILDVPVKQLTAFMDACAAMKIDAAKKTDAVPNMVSSYPAVDIFTADGWLREGVYKDIFNSFNYAPAVKINITDCNQSLVPLFSGHINWISSTAMHFWYLYVRLPATSQVYCFPELVYTNDMATVSRQVEEIINTHTITTVNDLYRAVKSGCRFIAKPVEKELEPPKFALPYYEGFNRYHNNYWLGIYRRDEIFSVRFLSELCTICMNTKIGQLYTTPWKSIIIKGIENNDRNTWDYVLGKYRINVRHAANELNWQVEDNCEDGLQLKRQVIRHFDKEDVRTYGLCFAVKMKTSSSIMGSVIIRKQETRNPGRLKALERFEILYTADFNPNTSHIISYRKGIEKEYLGIYLVSLCKYFYERASREISIENINMSPDAIKNEQPVKMVYQCKHCFTIYDEAAGDTENHILAGTAFNQLPADYRCALCEANPDDFISVDAKQLIFEHL